MHSNEDGGSSGQVVKPHSRQVVVKPEVLHLLECLCTGYRVEEVGHDTLLCHRHMTLVCA